MLNKFPLVENQRDVSAFLRCVSIRVLKTAGKGRSLAPHETTAIRDQVRMKGKRKRCLEESIIVLGTVAFPLP